MWRTHGRPEQWWARGPIQDAEDVALPRACSFAGCSRRLSTKQALSHHVL